MKKMMMAAVFVAMGFAACTTDAPPDNPEAPTTETGDPSSTASDIAAATDLTPGDTEALSIEKPTCQPHTCVQRCVCARLWCLYSGGSDQDCWDDLNACKADC